MSDDPPIADIAQLAKGGRTNFFGFLLRLAARAPFIFIAGRLYGAAALGRYAYALVAIELAAQLATWGQTRGLAQQLSDDRQPPAHAVADGMMLTVIGGSVMVAILTAFPILMFPKGGYTELDRLLPSAIIPFSLTDVSLAALAYRYDIGSTVKARSVVEPWALVFASVAAFFIVPQSGLQVAYIVSIFSAAIAALIPLIRAYGLPHGWTPHPLRIAKLALANVPLTMADMVEWGLRKVDIAILGLFASTSAVGVYYAAQQVASLPQKLKTSFQPILGPVITRALNAKDYAAIAKQVCQVGFWITAMQAGIALALGIPGKGVMGLFGPEFVGGTGALNFLLVAEVVAATAVVSEAALIYVARVKNLWVSLSTIGFQAALTVTLMTVAKRYHMPEGYYAAGAAISLMLALAGASLTKGFLLSRILNQRINNWRWALVWAAAPAIVVGWFVTRYTPEWAELLFGVPAILFVYGWVIWHRGFGPEDRVLFRRNVGPTLEGELAELDS